MDIECYRDYFLVMFKNISTGRSRAFEMFEGHPLDIEMIEKIIRKYTLITFNGNNYDIPMLFLAMRGTECSLLKDASDSIIQTNLRGWQFEKKFGIFRPSYLDHIDLIEVAPGQASLKIYGGRLHSKKMQDLPIEPDALISESDRVDLVTYCGNDLQTTEDLFNKLSQQIALREKMSDQYGIDLRSKSDAQIAEAVIKHGVEKATGERVFKPDFKKGQSFKYRSPDCISFSTEAMQRVFSAVKAASFTVSDEGSVEMPAALDSARIKIGDSVYRMGIGGLHSSESTVANLADDDHLLIDRDVASYYPSIILNLRLYPKHLGPLFLAVYKEIYDRRLKAKASGDSVVADSLKIVINGSFGKFGSRWSILYSPDLLIQTTVTGQLYLLMLIETLEESGIKVVSANTDGIVIRPRKDQKVELDNIISEWEKKTRMATEETQYSAVYSRDVNNYIAFKTDGKYKAKGAYASAGLQKNPTSSICTEAAIEFLKSGTPVHEHIRACEDIRKFIVIRQVKGGGVHTFRNIPSSKTLKVMGAYLSETGWQEVAHKVWVHDDHLGEFDVKDAFALAKETADGAYLGKAVRWYYTADRSGCITYKMNGNKVPKSDGAAPIMELPDEIPGDIDYDWYVAESKSILADVGVDELTHHFAMKSKSAFCLQDLI